MTSSRRNLLSTAIALLLVASARAEWRIVSTERQSIGPAGVAHVKTLAQDDAQGRGATLHFAVFSTRIATLRVIDDPDGSGTLASTMQREHCIAGVNGGYFDPQDAPVGLLISSGRVVAPKTKARLLSGVVSVVNGRVQIQRAAEFSIKTKPSSARQCGPFLMERGKAVRGLNDTRPARRTFVAIAGDDQAAIGYSTHVTLAGLAEILASPGVAPNLKLQRALNLDGGSSSGFWFGGENGAFSIREQKSVRDYLAIVPR